MKKIIIVKLILLSTLLLGCGTDTETSADSHDEHEEEAKNEVVLTNEQIIMGEIEISKIEPRNLSGYIKATGEVKINPDQESKVGGIISGRIKKINVKEGSYVRSGQVLATIENLDLIDIQTDYVEALHEHEHSKTEFERQQRLRETNIGSERELAKLKAEYEHALVSLRTSEQKLESYQISKNRFSDTIIDVQRYFYITAPISGNLVSRMITVGQYVDPSMDMFYIVNTSTVFVDINVFEEDLGKISIGQRVDIQSESYSGEIFEGKISMINNVFDDQSRTVKIRVIIDNKSGRLLPNMFITAKIYIKEGLADAVSKSAIQEEGEAKYVYVKMPAGKHLEDQHAHEDENHDHEGEESHSEDIEREEKEGVVFKKVPIRTGIEDDDYVEIIFLEEPGSDEIVSKGIFYLKSEMQKGELEHHDH
jgi:cobalt-zinc-cadmium efflux system membrane fusion protein